jgi:hypothetical protein
MSKKNFLFQEIKRSRHLDYFARVFARVQEREDGARNATANTAA